MKQWSIIIQNPTGLHARPARLFVDTAKKFSSTIQVQHASRTANGKSMISMLTLGAERGAEVVIRVSGADENDAYVALEKLISTGFGEGVNGAHGKVAPPQAHSTPEATPVALPIAPSIPSHLIESLIAAPGIAIGPVFQLKRAVVQLAAFSGDVETERQALNTAIAHAKTQILLLRDRLTSHGAVDEAAIFDAQHEIIEDPDLLGAVTDQIAEGDSAARAWQAVILARAARISQLSDVTLAARAADVRDAGDRVLRLLAGGGQAELTLPEHPVIIVAQELTPSDMASFDRSKVLGICIAEGGPTAHASIIARSLGIPSLVSADTRLHALADGARIILSAAAGRNGTIDISPSTDAIANAEAAHQTWQNQRAQAAQSSAQPAITQDGHRVEVVANIGSVADARLAVASGAEGVGLLRTEFLFIDSPVAPSEQTQFEAYRDILQAMQGRPVIIRTLDIGGDKPVSYLDMPPEKNPFLGERGIRLCLNRPELLRTQLRALLRAAEFGAVRIMVPMIADIDELRAVRTMLTQLKSEMNAAHVDLGIMIEVPSAAVMADIFAPEIDFFSVGTNDLTQYTLAMDRQHPVLANKADALHPAVLRLISQTVEAAHKAGKWVGVCGEIGADLQAVPILVGLGVDELSVNPSAIALVKAHVRSLNLPRAQALARKALMCATATDVRKLAMSY